MPQYTLKKALRIATTERPIYGELLEAGTQVEVDGDFAQSLANDGFIDIPAPKASPSRPVGGSKKAAADAIAPPAPPADSE